MAFAYTISFTVSQHVNCWKVQKNQKLCNVPVLISENDFYPIRVGYVPHFMAQIAGTTLYELLSILELLLYPGLIELLCYVTWWQSCCDLAKYFSTEASNKLIKALCLKYFLLVLVCLYCKTKVTLDTHTPIIKSYLCCKCEHEEPNCFWVSCCHGVCGTCSKVKYVCNAHACEIIRMSVFPLD